ncbi:hypothetical protein A6F49_16230 [Enteractinococcus helveticum]|uniref:Uncharacterized protein n=1 Tax=Enteractinococcus helveticum TaxID=1837282 RepID=A0A1B7LWJ6_9MICC|nr:hypothetical protein A6F49_16230 [Enteractinococcus helveticum]
MFSDPLMRHDVDSIGNGATVVSDFSKECSAGVKTWELIGGVIALIALILWVRWLRTPSPSATWPRLPLWLPSYT